MNSKVPAVSTLIFVVFLATVSSLPLLQPEQVEQLQKRSTDGDSPPPAVPPFAMSLFRSFGSDKNHQPSHHQYNVLRTFENTNFDGCHESQYNFHYNISVIQKDEDISKAIFRVYMNVTTPPTNHLEKAYLYLMYLNGSEILTRLVKLDKSDFVEFAVAESVQYWLKHDSNDITKQHGFSIRIQYMSQGTPHDCQHSLIKLEQSNTYPVIQPMLAVYSYNHNENSFLDRSLNDQSLNEKRQKRSSSSNTTTYNNAIRAIKNTTGTNCQRYSLHITSDNFFYLTGINLVAPSTFDIGTCGGECESFQQTGDYHSKMLDHIIANTRDHVPPMENKHRYKKCCIPFTYKPINFVIYDTDANPPVVTISTFYGITIDKCKCIYTYDHSA